MQFVGSISKDLKRLEERLKSSDVMSYDLLVPVLESVHRCLDDILVEADYSGDEVLEDMAVRLMDEYEDLCMDFRIKLAYFLGTTVLKKVESYDWHD